MTEIRPKPRQVEKNVGSNLTVNQNSMYIFNATFRKSAELGELLIIQGFWGFAFSFRVLLQ